MRRITALLAFVISTVTLHGLTISGRVFLDGKPLANASVGIIETNMAVLTNNKGEFSIKPLIEGEYHVSVVHPRAQHRILPVLIKRDFVIDIDVDELAFEQRALRLPHPPQTPTSYTRDYREIVSRAPGVFGFSPNYLTQLPSISKGGLLFEAPIVRGQSPRLNSYEVDGLAVDLPFHALGVFNTINLRHVDSVEVFRGVSPVDSRDQLGAGRLRYELPANYHGRNGATGELGFVQSNGFVQYQLSDWVSGSFAARNTHVHRLYDSSIDARLFDYQGKTVLNPSPRHRIELVYLGMYDPIKNENKEVDLDGVMELESHAQKIEYEVFLKRNQILSLALKNRYFDKSIVLDEISLAERSSIVSVNPGFTYEYQQFKVFQVGANVFFEKREASMSAASTLFAIPSLPASVETPTEFTYQPGQVTNFGGFMRTFGKRGLLGWDLSARMDNYDNLEAPVGSAAGMGYLVFLPDWKWYVGGGLFHRRVEPLRQVGLSDVKALKPEEVIKAETGFRWQATDDLGLSIGAFQHRWRDLTALDPFVPEDNPYATGIYQNRDELSTYGFEATSLWHLGWFYWRLGYTYQYMPPGVPFYYFHRRHIVNTAIALLGDISFTTQLKVWSNLATIDNKTANMISPTAQLDFRFEQKVHEHFTYYIEIGQVFHILLLGDRYDLSLTSERLREYTDEAFYTQMLFSQSEKSGPTVDEPISDTPLHFAFGLQWKI